MKMDPCQRCREAGLRPDEDLCDDCPHDVISIHNVDFIRVDSREIFRNKDGEIICEGRAND